MRQLLELCDGCYSQYQMERLELLILQRLGFGLLVATPAFFLDLYATWWQNSLLWVDPTMEELIQ